MRASPQYKKHTHRNRKHLGGMFTNEFLEWIEFQNVLCRPHIKDLPLLLCTPKNNEKDDPCHEFINDCETHQGCKLYQNNELGSRKRCVSADRVKTLSTGNEFSPKNASLSTTYEILNVHNLTDYNELNTGRVLTSYALVLKNKETDTIFIAFSTGEYNPTINSDTNIQSMLGHTVWNTGFQQCPKIILCGHSAGCTHALLLGKYLIEGGYPIENVYIFGTGPPNVYPDVYDKFSERILVVMLRVTNRSEYPIIINDIYVKPNTTMIDYLASDDITENPQKEKCIKYLTMFWDSTIRFAPPETNNESHIRYSNDLHEWSLYEKCVRQCHRLERLKVDFQFE
jgi:hypothetical protein